MVDRDKLKKRERAFRVPTHITFDNEGSEIYTMIEVDTRDRPGLLFDLARTLATLGSAGDAALEEFLRNTEGPLIAGQGQLG